MSKVFIIEPPRHNIDTSKAEKYGDIVYVFNYEDRRCSVWSHVCFGQTVLDRLIKLEFDADKDNICVVGSMVTVVIALITIAQRYDKFNVLLFNSSDDDYVKKEFTKYDYNWKVERTNDETKNQTATKTNQRV